MNKKQKRQQKMLRQQEIVTAARDAGRDLTAEEQTEFDSLQREIDTLTAEIEAEERQAGQGTPAPVTPQANPTDTQRAVEEERERIRSITNICRDFGLEADSYIQNGSTVDAVREAALEHIRQGGAPIPALGRATVTDS
ncbi:fels-1 prophage protease subunit of ATP-dependent protease, partial [gut metagenome]